MAKKTPQPYLKPNRYGVYHIHYVNIDGEKKSETCNTRVYADAEPQLGRFIARQTHLRQRGRTLTIAGAYAHWREHTKATSLEKTDKTARRLGIYQNDGLPKHKNLGARLIWKTSTEDMAAHWNAVRDNPREYLTYERDWLKHDRLEDGSLRTYQSVVVTAINHAIDWKLINADETPKIVLFEPSDSRVDFWLLPDVRRIDQAIRAASHTEDSGEPPSRMLVLWTILIKSAVRLDRAMHARWDLVDWTKWQVDFTRVYSPPETRDKPDARHRRGIKPGMVHKMGKELYRLLAWAYKHRRSDDDLILQNLSDLRLEFQAVLAELGLVGTFHTAKHTCISLLIAAGYTLEQVSLMTNTSMATLESVYLHAVRDRYGDMVDDAIGLGNDDPPPGGPVLPLKPRRR